MAEPQERVIFLDVDGVIVLFSNRGEFDVGCMNELKRVVTSTNAKIVMSSNWKRSEESLAKLNKQLSHYGLQPVYAVTPECEFQQSVAFSRVKEIFQWLNEFPSANNLTIASWVAVDDMDLQKEDDKMIGHFVRTGREKGITPEKADAMINMLTAGL